MGKGVKIRINRMLLADGNDKRTKKAFVFAKRDVDIKRRHRGYWARRCEIDSVTPRARLPDTTRGPLGVAHRQRRGAKEIG